MQEGLRVSGHPTDVLIRELISTSRDASPQEITSVLRRMVEAEFPTAQNHLVERKKDFQWSHSSTAADYIADLRAAVHDPEAKLAVYLRQGGNIAAVLTRTERIVPEDRLGSNPLVLLFVVYSADRGIIISGYEASALDRIAIPRGARWLR